MDQGAEGEARTPGDLEVELFPCKGGCQDISVLPAGAHSGPDGRTVRAGLPASAVLPPIPHLSPPPPPAPAALEAHSPDKGCEQPNSFLSLAPSLLSSGN